MPTFGRLWHGLFNWRSLGRILIALAMLATLIGLFYAEENWRGKHAWLKYKSELEAKGEKVDFRDFIPPAVPDDQNFAMTPFLAPLFDFNPRPLKEGQSNWRDTNAFGRAVSFASDFLRLADRRPNKPSRAKVQMTDLQSWAIAMAGKTNVPALTPSEAATAVLAALERDAPVLEEIRVASQRTYARFNIRYDEDLASCILLPHLAVLKSLAWRFQLRASAELALDRVDQAWADTRLAIDLSDSVKNEPFLISKLVQFSLIRLSLQPIWEGLAQHKWSDAQLVKIQQRLGDLRPLAGVGLHGERAMNILVVDQLRSWRGRDRADALNSGLAEFAGVPYVLMPGGWFYQNELAIARIYQQLTLPIADGPNARFYPSTVDANWGRLDRELRTGFPPFKIFARLLIPALSRAEVRFASIQTRVNEAMIACALERYRLVEGRFPEKLDALSPRFLAAIPQDIITGQPLKYKVASDGHFVLYSVGWNESDDGGTMATRKGMPSEDLTQGDWVWEYPAG